MKTGLVLEGGGMRGLFTAGILDVWMENGVEFDGIIGVSAGATFGCNVKSRQPGRVLRYNLRFKNDPKYMGLRSLLKTGDLVGADYAYHVLPTQLDIFDKEAFESNPVEFHLVCTDVETGAPYYYRMDKVTYESLEWMRASASMPIVSRPVELNGHKYLDGGIADSIPLKHFQSLGYQRNVVILTQPKGFTKKRTKLMPIFKATMKKYPAIIEAMNRRHLMYNDELNYITQQEQLGDTLIINPEDTLPISRTNQNEKKMRHVYEMGREAGEVNLERVRQFLAKSKKEK